MANYYVYEENGKQLFLVEANDESQAIHQVRVLEGEFVKLEVVEKVFDLR